MDTYTEIWECSRCGEACRVEIKFRVDKRPSHHEQEPARFKYWSWCVAGLESHRAQWTRKK